MRVPSPNSREGDRLDVIFLLVRSVKQFTSVPRAQMQNRMPGRINSGNYPESPMRTPPSIRHSIAIFVTLLAPSFVTLGAGDKAEALTMEAAQLLDRWDGESEILETADKLLQEAMRLDPASTHAMAEQARRVLLAGTEEEGVRPSALRTAEGLLNRALTDSPHPRVMALSGHLYNLLGQPQNVWKSLKPAERSLPNDPWVKLYWAEYYAAMHDQPSEIRYLEEAIAAGLANKRELRKALHTMLPYYIAFRMREKADAAYARIVAMDSTNPMIRGDFARGLILGFGDFETSARVAREALAMADFPHARQTLSLALYGRWAQAARDGKGPDVVERLYREATANDPDGRQLPSCLASYGPVEFVFERLAAKQFRIDQMHRC
jgi:tetratricopeptide (TPR) repeat protein